MGQLMVLHSTVATGEIGATEGSYGPDEALFPGADAMLPPDVVAKFRQEAEAQSNDVGMMDDGMELGV